MRIARSVSPRRRNRLPSAKCSSTVCGSTLTTSMKASIALSGCSLSRKLRPLKYERGSEHSEEQQRAQQPRQMGDELHLTDRRKGGTPPLYPQNLSLQENASLSGSVFNSLPTTSSKANGGTSSMPPSARLRPRLLFLIDSLAQFLAGFEMRHEFLGYVDPLARFRIAADARRPMIQPETPESADLDALPLDQALRHRIQDHLDREFGILGDELRITRREPRT